jgi:hypothetical protein
MKSRCCRSTPRCAACPVLARAAARHVAAHSLTAALITEVFVGRQPRPLPATVLNALERLDGARARDASPAFPDRPKPRSG